MTSYVNPFNDTPPLGWGEPDLPADLPPHEQKYAFPFEVWGKPAMHPPHFAPGFTRAHQRGLLPAPPASGPPTPLPGPSARALFIRALVLIGAMFALIAVVPSTFGWLYLLVGLPAMYWIFRLFVRDIPQREDAEHDADYTSSASNFVGVWRLAPDGTVLREPDRTVAPPGWYPSPYYVGLLQRWDGPGWKPLAHRWRRHEHLYFKVPDEPFL